MSLIGTKIGRIRIVESLGRGGMGEVFSGWDETLKRKVALKVIRDDQRLDAEARARFLREARILSQLDHPGICRIYEIIEDPSADVLVLERIVGQSLEQAMEAGLEPAHKLYIAEKIAEALAIAHRQGVVHRDLKPENVMLTDDGLVKVLDFGLANAVDNRLATAISAAEAGSPEPGSPEPGTDSPLEPTVVASASKLAFALDPVDSSTPPTVWLPRTEADDTKEVDETTDLANRGDPTEGMGPAASEQPTQPGRLQPEPPPAGSDDDPPDPIFATQDGAIMGTVAYMSPEQARGDRVTAASDLYSLGLLLQEMATGQSPYPPGLKVLELLVRAANGSTRAVTGLDPDLTALIERLKAVAPEARPSAAEAAERLWWIRGKKRRLWQRLAAVAAGLLLLLGAAKYTLDLHRERTAAVTARQEAESVAELLVQIFAVADPRAARGADITARELLDAGAERITAGLENQPLVRARLQHTLGRVYRQLGLFERAVPLLERAVADRRHHAGDDLETANYLDQTASVYHDLGRFSAAEQAFEQALDLRRRFLGPDHPHVAASLGNLAFVHQARGDTARAEPLLLRALEIQRETLGPRDLQVARSLVNLGELYRTRGDLDLAEAHLQQSLEIQESILGNRHPDLATACNNLAIVHQEKSEPERARELYRRALDLTEATYGEEHPAVAISLNNLAELHRQWGSFAEAAPLYERATAIQEAALGPKHPSLAVTLANRGKLEAALGNASEADALYQQALEIQSTSLGPDHPGLALTSVYRADLLRGMGYHSEARRLYEQALAIFREIPEPRSELVKAGATSASIALAGVELDAGAPERARDLLSQTESQLPIAVAGGELVRGADKTRIASLRLQQGRAFLAGGEPERARELWRRALELLEGSEKVADLDLRCQLLLLLGRIEEAGPLQQRLEDLGWRNPLLIRLLANPPAGL